MIAQRIPLLGTLAVAAALAGCEAASEPSELGPQEPDCTLFVSEAGSDEAAGSEADPFGTIQGGVDAAVAGDVVCVAAGDYADERIRVTRSGTASQPIVIRAEGAALTRGFTIIADNVTVSSFEVTNRDLDDAIDGHGIFLQGDGIVVVNNYVHDTRANGINCWHQQPYCTNSAIIGNTVDRADGTGIRVFGNDNLIEYNEVMSSIREHSGDADGIRFFGDGHTFRYNFIHDIYDRGYQGEGPHTDCFQTFDNSKPATRDVIIESNWCHDVDHQCLMASAAESEQEGQIGRSRHIIFRNNICDNNGGQAVNAYQFPEMVIVNNLFTENIQYRAIYLSNGSTDAVIMNNVFYGDYMHYEGPNADSSSGMEADHNLRYSPGGSGFVWDEINGLWEVDPQFENVDDSDFFSRYRLLPGSPAIDSGSPYYISLFDLAGNPRMRDGSGDGVAMPDMGPYEF
jgi:hypothetical protein